MEVDCCVAVDWSGRLKGQRRAIQLACVAEDRCTVSGKTRIEVEEYLLRIKEEIPNVVVGLDFAFGYPAWFVEECEVSSGIGMLSHLSEDRCEAILKGHQHSDLFWGRPHNPKRPARLDPKLGNDLRQTERAFASEAIRPKTVFQIYGAGAVGTGTLRGIPSLDRLRNAGFAIWPFDPPKLPMIVEIYPRVLTGAVRKSASEARRSYVEERYAELPSEVKQAAQRSEDAFDALISALKMYEHRSEFMHLKPPDPVLSSIEGEIWLPNLVD